MNIFRCHESWCSCTLWELLTRCKSSITTFSFQISALAIAVNDFHGSRSYQARTTSELASPPPWSGKVSSWPTPVAGSDKHDHCYLGPNKCVAVTTGLCSGPVCWFVSRNLNQLTRCSASTATSSGKTWILTKNVNTKSAVWRRSCTPWEGIWTWWRIWSRYIIWLVDYRSPIY